MSNRKVVRLSFNISRELVDDLRAIATKRGSTMTSVLAQAIGSLRFVQDAQDRGQKILVEQPDGSTHRVVFI